jgi:hypothetical protein
MHCPNCGKPAAGDQQFCRSCGMSLEAVGKLVVQHSSSSVEVQRRNDKVAMEQAAIRTMFNWLILGMIILGAGVAMIIVNKNFDIGKWFSLLASFFILGGTGVATAGVLNPLRQAANFTGSPNQKSLPTNPVPDELPSITERTTQLIKAEEARTNKLIK